MPRASKLPLPRMVGLSRDNLSLLLWRSVCGFKSDEKKCGAVGEEGITRDTYEESEGEERGGKKRRGEQKKG